MTTLQNKQLREHLVGVDQQIAEAEAHLLNQLSQQETRETVERLVHLRVARDNIQLALGAASLE